MLGLKRFVIRTVKIVGGTILLLFVSSFAYFAFFVHDWDEYRATQEARAAEVQIEQAEKARIAEEKRVAKREADQEEQIRIAEEARIAEEQRLADEQAANDRALEKARIAEEQNYIHASDIEWSDRMLPHKDVILAGVNGIRQQNKECATTIDTGLIGVSFTSGTEDDPEFFVWCGHAPEGPQIYFSKSQVESGAPLVPKAHVARSKAIGKCRTFIKRHAMYPNTVDMSSRNMRIQEANRGRTIIRTTFTMKNSYGAEHEYRVQCTVVDGVDTTGTIEESY